MKYIDIHCHLDFPDYGEEINGVLERMREKEVGAITIGTDLESSKRAVEIANQNPNIWACIGVHPRDDSPEPPSPDSGREGQGGGVFPESGFEKLVSHPKVVAIGECGLDWFRILPESMEAERERQTNLFKQQIEFALKYDKPLMLHCRESYDDVLEILEKYKNQYGSKLRGNAHFFAGTVEQAKKFVDLGFTISFTGVITFTHDYDEAIKNTPIESILSETDAPFVAPVPHRGKRNEPAFVVEVVQKLSEIKDLDHEDLRLKLLENTKRMFGIKLL